MSNASNPIFGNQCTETEFVAIAIVPAALSSSRARGTIEAKDNDPPGPATKDKERSRKIQDTQAQVTCFFVCRVVTYLSTFLSSKRKSGRAQTAYRKIPDIPNNKDRKRKCLRVSQNLTEHFIVPLLLPGTPTMQRSTVC